MNYKHQYHFGNFADIFKHIILTVSLEEFVKNKIDLAFNELKDNFSKLNEQLDVLKTALSGKTVVGDIEIVIFTFCRKISKVTCRGIDG